MTKFEMIGISHQNEAVSTDDAVRRFKKSCEICCNRGLRIDCDFCAVSFAHEATLAAFEVLRKSSES